MPAPAPTQVGVFALFSAVFSLLCIQIIIFHPSVDDQGRTPLFFAAANGMADSVALVVLPLPAMLFHDCVW